MTDTTGDVGVWYAVLGAALAIPGARVDRKEFLANEFKKYCNTETLEKALKEGTTDAGIETTLLDKVANDAINAHSAIATSISFATGIPGGLAMAATIPADIAQYYYQLIVVAQKLAYIYGMMDMGMVDDNFKGLITLLLGSMADVEDAGKTVTELYSTEATKNVANIALGKGLNKIVLRVAVALSYRLTGKTVFKSIWKAIPVLGGVVSGAITLFTFTPMCEQLKDRLHNSIENRVKKQVSANVVKSTTTTKGGGLNVDL